MSIVVLQKPKDIQASQSPIVFSVLASGSAADDIRKDGFQYTANLYIWSGALNNSGSYLYKYKKYPSGVYGNAIFDFHNAIDSSLTLLAAENRSYIKYYKVDFGYEYTSGSSTFTSSLTPVTGSDGCSYFKAYDGYNLWPGEDDDLGTTNVDIPKVNVSLSGSCTNWPWMTDLGTVTQSVYIGQPGLLGNNSGTAFWRSTSDNPLISRIVMTASYANGTQLFATASNFLSGSQAGTGTTNNINYRTLYPVSSFSSSFIDFGNLTTTNLSSYTVQAFSGSIALGNKLNFKVDCPQYYVPVTIAYKNKYGQFDYINFFKRSNKSFETQTRTYQPQVGTWDSFQLTYDEYQTKYERYVVDANEMLEVNSDWLEEGYNNLIKQMMVSNEIYWLDGDAFYTSTGRIIPLTIKTNEILFKTHVNNKLIQYSFVFNLGQPYKLQL
jgi:hypothetical protein